MCLDASIQQGYNVFFFSNLKQFYLNEDHSKAWISESSAGTDADRVNKKGSWEGVGLSQSQVKVKSRWAWIKTILGCTEHG